MEPAMAGKKYRCIGLIGLAVVLCGTSMECTSPSKPKEPPPFGYHALKINGQFVGPEIFFKEQNIFYMRSRRNAEMLHKSNEERTDMMLGEIIDQMVTEDYLYHHCGIMVAPKEVDDYVNRCIKAKFVSSEDFHAFMQNNDYKSEADLKKSTELYLLKLKFFSAKAKETGMTIPIAELDSLYKAHVNANRFFHPKDEFSDITLMERFGNSERFKTWIAGIKSKVSIEILDPAMKAYRLYCSGRYDQAGALYEKAFRERVYEPDLQRAIESYRIVKNWSKVIKLCQAGMKKYPEKVTYDIGKAEGLYRNGKVSEAIKMLKNAEIRSQESVFFRESVIEMYETLGLMQEAQRMRTASSK
jgi:tetratricopeptide (TPR) repeat protein